MVFVIKSRFVGMSVLQLIRSEPSYGFFFFFFFFFGSCGGGYEQGSA